MYQAEALILVDIKKGPTTVEKNILDPTQTLGLVRVHSHLLQSTAMLKKVIVDLQLYRKDGSTLETGESDGPAAAGLEKKIQALVVSFRNKNLVIASPPFTNLIEVRVKYQNPELAAEITNTLVKNYLAWNVKFEHAEADRLLEYLENETTTVKRRLAGAEFRLRRFKTNNHIMDLSEEIKAYFQILPEQFKAYYQVTQAVEIKLLELSVERSRLKELYTEQSSQIRYLDQTIEEVKQQLKDRLGQADLGENFLSGLSHVPEKEMELVRLLRQVKIQESLYTFLLDEKTKAGLLKAKQNMESVQVVSWAELPLRPAGRFKGIALGIVASFLFAFLAVVGLEFGRTSVK